MSNFVGVSFGVIDNKLVAIATSEGYSAVAMEGFESKEALAFLSSLTILRDKRIAPKPALIMFNAAVDIELLLRDVTPEKKDVLFGLYRAAENENKMLPIFDPTTPEYRGIVDFDGYRISTLPGKVLRIARLKHAGLIFYDIVGYFECETLNDAVCKFLNNECEVQGLEKNLAPLWESSTGQALAMRSEAEARLTVKLAEKVNQIVAPLDINLRQWYGPSAVAARCLHKWGARKQAKRLTEKNSVFELRKAIDCAYFGGRVEALKLGTIKDVRTYDLNSAYAYATTLLSQFYTPLRFTRQYVQDAPFSCWLVNYCLPSNVTLGVLPTRQPMGGISFRREGQGYFWQPEVDYLRQRYPDSFKVEWGYVGPEYQPVTFAKAIKDMYVYRQQLKAAGDNGEMIIKLALSNLYGKFAQNTGAAYFQCRAWAGWITSLVRRLLLEAVTGIEDRVICFAQDAIHITDANAQPKLTIGDGLGEWKEKRFASGLYVSPGIYQLIEYGESPKQKDATRGCNLGLNFERIANDLSMRQVTELTRSFYVGWALSRQARSKYSDSYLSEVQESLDIIPAQIRSRNYLSEFDWSNEFRNSQINSRYSGQLSARYIPNESGHTVALRLRLKDRGWI